MYVFHTGDPQDAPETSPAPGMRDQFHFNFHSVGFILEQETAREDNKCLLRHLYATKEKTVQNYCFTILNPQYSALNQPETDVFILISQQFLK